MPEMWEQEGLGRAGSCQRGDIQKELSAHWFIKRALVYTVAHAWQDRSGH